MTNALTELRRKQLTEAINSPELKTALTGAISEIQSGLNFDSNEATISGAFERVLYSVLREIGLKFDISKEDQVETKRHTAKSGRIDSRIGAIVIEYKRPNKFKTDSQVKKAIEQISDYLESLSLASPNQKFAGFVTDGFRFCEVNALNGKIISKTSPTQIDTNTLVRFSKSIYALDLVALTSSNLIKDFCADTTNGVLLKAARNFYTSLNRQITDKTNMLLLEWEEVFRLGHDDKSQQKKIEERRRALEKLFDISIKKAETEYLALFCLHTAYAVVVKLMAFRVVSELQLKQQMQSWNALVTADSEPLRAFCERLEDGEVFRDLSILNLLEGDFFSWYSDQNQWDNLICEGIREIIVTLSRYEQTSDLFTSSGAVDLFRELYEASVPQPIRSSFGEFYTPGWLTSHVIESSEPSGNWRLLDPCSGSGTFLISGIDKLRTENENITLQEILSRVVGIDLNPLGVLTSRVNYFIHISNLLSETMEDVVIPVFLGDASNIPEQLDIEGVNCVKYKLKTLKSPIEVTLPLSYVKNTAVFVKSMLDYEKAIQLQDEVQALSIITNEIPADELNESLVTEITKLTKNLVEMESKGWNGIWARIITNFLSTIAIGKFDVIVGNPPWVDWKNLPAGYRERIKDLCVDRGLFSGDGMTGGINLNICALISHVCISNWLSDSGRLAFLMPRELVFQQSYQGWRNLHGKTSAKFTKFIDWTKAGHPFDPVKEDFMTFIIGNGKQQKIVPVESYYKNTGEKSRANSWKDLSEAKSKTTVKKRVAGQITPNSTAFTFANTQQELEKFALIAGECAYIGREGIEFYPQELLLFKYQKRGVKSGTAFLKNIQVTKSKFKIPERDRLLETKYLFPLVKGSGIKAFKYEDDGFIVPFPYNSSDPRRPFSKSILQKTSPLLLSFYTESESIIRSQTEFSDKIRGNNAGEFYGLARTGAYSFADVYVCYRDNTDWCAAVVSSKEMPWNEEKRFVFQNHAVSMCERNSGGFITEDEAHYICAILNAPVVKKFIHSSSDERSFKIRLPVYVPLYDSKNETHRRLSKLSKAAHKSEGDEKILGEIESLYLELCESKTEVAKYKPNTKKK